MKYTVILEKTGTGYSAYAPDVDGCVASGKTFEATKRRMTQALRWHLQAMAEDGKKIPPPNSLAAIIEAA